MTNTHICGIRVIYINVPWPWTWIFVNSSIFSMFSWPTPLKSLFIAALPRLWFKAWMGFRHALILLFHYFSHFMTVTLLFSWAWCMLLLFNSLNGSLKLNILYHIADVPRHSLESSALNIKRKDSSNSISSVKEPDIPEPKNDIFCKDKVIIFNSESCSSHAVNVCWPHD